MRGRGGEGAKRGEELGRSDAERNEAGHAEPVPSALHGVVGRLERQANALV